MIFPYQRYRELYDMSRNREMALTAFDTNDWLDLQVWYNLTWIGRFSRERTPVKRLLKKGRNFTEQEKIMLMNIHLEIMNQVKSQFRNLKNLGQLELSCTPMYHPILPLLCNSEAALEAMPDAKMPDKRFAYPEDAKAQIANSLEYMKDLNAGNTIGMWPSEGSISDEALNLIAKSGIKWVASDEEILQKTLKEKYNPLMKYFPIKYQSPSGDVAILFRDHNLSDAIGFVYSRWRPFDAAANFCERLREIKRGLVDEYGEECLEHAVVPVILDGENCWEYYHEDGVNFRRELASQLTESSDFLTVTCSEASDAEHFNFIEPLNHIMAGSWINANFSIWIGHSEDRAAWTMLSQARETVEKAKSELSIEQYIHAMEQIYIAEGSDWFWWYGDEHASKNKAEFDELFRWYIEKAYKAIGKEVPQNVFIPISQQPDTQELVKPSGPISPDVDGYVKDEQEWNNAGYFDAAAAMSAMHQVGEILVRFWYGADEESYYFRCDTTHKLKDGEFIEVQFIEPVNFSIIMRKSNFELRAYKNIVFNSLVFAEHDTVEFGISKSAFFPNPNADNHEKLELVMMTKTKEAEIFYPRQGSLSLEF